MDTMIVRAKHGLKILDPVRKDFIEPEGREVSSHDQYWNRRLRDGDVERVEHPAAAALEQADATDAVDADACGIRGGEADAKVKKSKSREEPKE